MTSASWRWTWSGTAPAQTRRAASSAHAAASSCGAAIAGGGGKISPATTLGGRSTRLAREGLGPGRRETAGQGGGEEGELRRGKEVWSWGIGSGFGRWAWSTSQGEGESPRPFRSGRSATPTVQHARSTLTIDSFFFFSFVKTNRITWNYFITFAFQIYLI